MYKFHYNQYWLNVFDLFIIINDITFVYYLSLVLTFTEIERIKDGRVHIHLTSCRFVSETKLNYVRISIREIIICNNIITRRVIMLCFVQLDSA